jgi:hypothetical protein
VPGDRSHDIPPIPRAWRADKITGSYVIRDANGQALVYIYSRDSEAEALQAKVLTKDEALSAFFVWAIREGIADENPVTGTNKPTEGMRLRESRGFVVSPPPPHAGQALPRRLLPPVRPGIGRCVGCARELNVNDATATKIVPNGAIRFNRFTQVQGTSSGQRSAALSAMTGALSIPCGGTNVGF